MVRGRTAAALLAAAALAVLAGCGGGSSTVGSSAAGATGATATAGPDSPPKQATRKPKARTKPEPAPTLAPSHCPSGHPACRSTEGRIVYVERVDPDGDGDAHFVVIDPHSITLPGLTAIDVRVGLRPHPLPGIGDRVSAAGPVQTGSYGQHQIHALEVHVAE